jgi:hypothetical protein
MVATEKECAPADAEASSRCYLEAMEWYEISGGFDPSSLGYPRFRTGMRDSQVLKIWDGAAGVGGT